MQNRNNKRSLELLAPAGGPEPFAAALAAGADAIYCGFGNDFNARRNATNFDDESFAAACKAAHLAGVRVYVTVNIVIRTAEMPKVLSVIRRAWCLGADAFIIQDWGLMAEVRRIWPEIEVHVSTQANIHDARAVAWIRELGIARVTISRELSLPELSRIADEGVEIEAFGHGALCFCYSGVCMLSSLSGGRSANRGMCAQPCRLPYDLVDEDGTVSQMKGADRALCPKDYCTISDLSSLMEAGVGSLKVEGRMKAPDYVYSVISSYRAELDDAYAGVKPSAETEHARMRRLLRSFNRGFTDAYLRGESGNEMMSYERSNNRGELVGEVVSSRRLEDTLVRRGGGNGGRRRNRHVTQAETEIALAEPVFEGDLLEIRPLTDPSQFLTATAEHDADAQERITVRTTRPMEKGSAVRVIRSKQAMEEAQRAAHLECARKRPVSVSAKARIGEPFTVTIETEDGISATAEGFTVEPARTKAVTEEDLKSHVLRMGQTPFEPTSWTCEIDDDCGMGFSAVHAVRQDACHLLEEKILAPYIEREEKTAPVPPAWRIKDTLREVRKAAGIQDPLSWKAPEPEISALVTTPEAAEAALSAGADIVYATPDALSQGTWPESTVPLLDEVCREIDHERLDPFVVPGRRVACGNMSELVLAHERGALPEIRQLIPVHNESALVALEEAGAEGIWLSPELTLEEIVALAETTSVPLGLSVYGRTRAMTSEHCILQAAGKCIHNCAKCQLRQRRFSLRDIDGALLPVRTDLEGRSHLYASHPLDATPQIPDLMAAGVTRFMADGTLLTPQEVSFAVERVKRAVAAGREDRKAAPRLQGATSGHLFVGIG